MPQPSPAVPQDLKRRPVPSARRGGGALLAAVAGLALWAPGAAAGSAGGGVEAGDPAAVAPSPAPAPATVVAPAGGLDRGTIRSVQRKLRLKADGKLGPRTRAAIRRYQRRHRLPATGRLFPATLRALDVRASAARATRRATPPKAVALTDADARVLAAIAQCESGGDPTAVSARRQHRGKYQFLVSTWEAMGGVGDPAAAPEAEQDERAAALFTEQGVKPWPVCGRRATAAAG